MKLTNRISESKRRVASLNRSDESNQRIEPQNGSTTTPKTAQIRPQSPQERPKTPKDGPKTAHDPPRSSLGTGWAAILGSSDHKIENQTAPDQWSSGSWVLGRCWLPKWIPKRPQIEPKTSQKSRRKMHHFLSLLDSSWTGLEAILG